MRRNLILAALFLAMIAESLNARGFGGGFGALPVGEGIGGTGALWTDSVMGTGAMWGDSAYGAGLPWFEGAPGGNFAYGGFFSGPPQLGMNKGGGTYHPLAGEQAMSAPQVDVGAQQRQAFVSSLAGTGIRMGGFRPGEFGPPPEAAGLPSDLGMHQAGGKNPHGYRGGNRGQWTASSVVSGNGTRNWSAADLRVLGNSARSAFRDYNIFSREWFIQHPRAWNTRGYVRDVWSPASWADLTGWFGGEWPDYEYTYGSELVYDGNTVYLYGRPIAAADKYYNSAMNIARTGAQASDELSAAEAKWLPLGVFEAIRGSEKSSTMLFQLAVNKAGILRGNYFDTADKNVQPVDGAVDKDTQRVAWVVADKKDVVFDCVLHNLTRAETPVLVHMGKDKNEQWVLVRLRQEPGRN